MWSFFEVDLNYNYGTKRILSSRIFVRLATIIIIDFISDKIIILRFSYKPGSYAKAVNTIKILICDTRVPSSENISIFLVFFGYY